MLGEVISFEEDHGYGFIVCEDSNTYFVHAKEVCTDINGLSILYPGDRVALTVVPSRKRSGLMALVTEIISPKRELVPGPHARESGSVVYVDARRRFAFAARGHKASGIFVGQRFVTALRLEVGQWIEYTPNPPRLRCKDEKGRYPLWIADSVALNAPPLSHADEIADMFLRAEAGQSS